MATEHTQNGAAGRHDLDIAGALERDEIDVHFQPKVDLRSARVLGVEALARWSHPGMGLLSAAGFIDAVRPGSQMRALTERVIEISTRAAGDWWRSGLHLQLSVNLPAEDLSAPDWALDTFVSSSLSAAGLPGEAIQFEVTEEALLRNSDLAGGTLERLTALGGALSIDDFGTGHFSLRQLIDLPIEELKIDRVLIAGLEDEKDKMIARAIIHLAHQIGLPVVAEGVENRDTWQQLRSMGCERAQGFLIAKPLPSREVPAWLAAWNHRARELSSTKRRLQRQSKAAPKRVTAPAEATA
jgi:EAL domain-containing protein (putative c-di-GMP-specific phosphodiesterase class I)